MATITLSTFGNYVGGTTGFADGEVIAASGVTTDTVVFPLLAPVGYKAFVRQDGAGTVTLSAAAGATIAGNTSLAVAETLAIVTKRSSTVWTSAIFE